jgi:hypothetical protein
MSAIPHAPSTMNEGKSAARPEHAERPTHAGYERSGGRENECRFGIE